MKKPIEVKEFQSIIYDSDYADIADYKCIEKKQFEDLVTFVREYTSVDEGNEAYDLCVILVKNMLMPLRSEIMLGLFR